MNLGNWFITDADDGRAIKVNIDQAIRKTINGNEYILGCRVEQSEKLLWIRNPNDPQARARNPKFRDLGPDDLLELVTNKLTS